MDTTCYKIEGMVGKYNKRYNTKTKVIRKIQSWEICINNYYYL